MKLNETFRKSVLIISIIVLISYPFVQAYICHGLESAFKFLAGDAFYYLSVAKNTTNVYFTFDGTTATNGFHPFWQFIILYLSKIIHNDIYLINFVLLLSLVFTTAGFILLTLTIYKLTNSFLLSIMMIPGIYYMLFSIVNPNYGAVWSFINGMESGISIFFFSIIVVITINNYLKRDKPNINHFICIGLFLPLIILSRLDDIFLLFGFIIIALFMKNSNKDRVKFTLLLIIPSLIILLLYLSFNYHYCGLFLPVSGLVKNKFSLFRTIYFTSLIVIPNYYSIWSFIQQPESTWRVLQLLVPLSFFIFLSVYIVRISRKTKNEILKYIYLLPFIIYAVMKLVYNLLMVPLWDQGFWYMPNIIIMFNFILIIIFHRIYKNFNLTLKKILGVLVVLFILIHTNNFTYIKIFSDYNQKYIDFYEDRQKIIDTLKKMDSNMKLLECDDGIINYSLNFPSISALGLNIDKKGYEAYKNGNLMDYAYNRGFNIISTLVYTPAVKMNTKQEIESAIRHWRPFDKQGYRKYNYRIIYHHISGALFIKFEKKK